MTKIDIVKQNLSFEEALFALREGRAVRRVGNPILNGFGSYLIIKNEKIVKGQWKISRTTNDYTTPYYSKFEFSSDDILANDWQTVRVIVA